LTIHSNLKANDKVRPVWTKNASMWMAAASVVLLAVVGWVLSSNLQTIDTKQTSNYRALRQELYEVVREQEKLAQSQKNATQNVRQFGATAFVIATEGFVLTNHHVIDKADSIYIEARYDSLVRYKVAVVYQNPAQDLAILQVKDTRFKTFGALPYTLRATEMDLGEKVFTLAYPRQDLVYGEGTISAKSGIDDRTDDDSTKYQISILTNPGNSGGPLFDERGNLAGIVSGKHIKLSGATFAVKARYVQAALDSLRLQEQKENRRLNLPTVLGQLGYLNRPMQIKQLQKLIFRVRVFEGRK
jgi:S1-C subfamily serine protease